MHKGTVRFFKVDYLFQSQECVKIFILNFINVNIFKNFTILSTFRNF